MEFLHKEQSYSIIGCCYEVYNVLGKGFNEVLYKDALAIEFNLNNIPFVREKKYKVEYKGIILPHFYNADFISDESIIIEVKACEMISKGHIKQCLNYLAASHLKVGLIINFGEDSLKYKRVVL